MTNREKACPKCKLITEFDICLDCKEKTTTKWSGIVGIVDKDVSVAAKLQGITKNGRYAMRCGDKK